MSSVGDWWTGCSVSSVPIAIITLLIVVQSFRSLLSSSSSSSTSSTSSTSPRWPSFLIISSSSHRQEHCHLCDHHRCPVNLDLQHQQPSNPLHIHHHLHHHPHLYSLPVLLSSSASSSLNLKLPSRTSSTLYQHKCALSSTKSHMFTVDLVWSCLLLLLVALLFAPIKAAIRPHCRCIVFDDTFGKEYGIFTSPDWPVPYEDNIDCLLYTFRAPKDHIVEITFDEFDVQKNSDVGCDYGDYVKLFLHLATRGITDRSPWNAVLCGKFPDIEQTHYSSQSVLIFEFHSDWRPGNNTGFRGTFRFLKKSLFHTDGQPVPSTACDYWFRHELAHENALNRKIHSTESVQDRLVQVQLRPTAPMAPQSRSPEEQMIADESDSTAEETAAVQHYGTSHRGHFYSPQYPSTYPKNTRCQFRFKAMPNERVRLLFVDISLQRLDQSCLTAPDIIRVFDGPNYSSPLIGQMCGQTSYVELLSSDEQLLVEFSAKSHISAKGFKAEYAFVPIVPVSMLQSLSSQFGSVHHPWWALPLPSSATKPKGGWQFAAGHNNTVGQSPTSIFSTSSSCDRWFSSDNGTSGTFTSPKYPLPYPANSRCSYHFVGRGKERVQILFQEFDVHKVEDQHRDCEISDSVTAYVTTNGQKEWIDDFCGNELPPRLMSNGHRLTIEFKSLAHNGPNGRRAPYHHQQVPMHKTFPGGLSPVVVTHKGKSSHPGLQPSKTTDNRVDEVEDYDRSDEDDDSGEDGEDGVKKFYFGPTIKPTASSSSSSSNNHNRNNNTATNGQQSLANQKAKGFRAIYRFVTNFGIEVGKQDSKSVCGFVYNSTVSKNGTFTSPNYPGLYPKDTECHYFFYGNSTERIQIVFTHFDVEGVTPCTLETASDYVEFSNMQSTERKMYRHCGLKHPKSVQSEGDFFRVTFKSNGRFDGTGFMATYGFLNTPGPNTQYKNTRNTVSTSMSTSATLGATTVPTLTLLCIVVLLLLLH